MDVPKPPQDIELRNIIDKLAQFVARNGPEFEQMTKTKQKGNPKFSFLFGGEHFNYYQYKVTTEQAILKLKDVRGAVDNSGANNVSVPPTPQGNQLAANTLSNIIMSAVQGINQQSGNPMPTMAGLADPAQAGLVAQWIVQHTQQQVQQQAAQVIPQPPPPLPGSTPPSLPVVGSMETLSQQQSILQEQINQSEQNLNAQHLVLLHHEEAQIETEIKKSELEKLQREADELGVSLTDFDSILQPIMDSCTKDSISNGKTWLLNRATCKSVNDLLARYLLYKVLDEPEKKFFRKLHVIYLVNDILHHCLITLALNTNGNKDAEQFNHVYDLGLAESKEPIFGQSVRKHIEGFKIALEEVVVPMFVNASLGVTEEQQSKLTKLLLIWEKKNHYFPDEIVSQLKDPSNSWERYKQQRLQDHADIVDSLKNNTKTAVSTFQSQHLAFVTHAQQQIQVLEQQKQAMIEQQHKDVVNPPIPSLEPKLITSQPPPNFDDGRSNDGNKDDKGLDCSGDHGWGRGRQDRDERSTPPEPLHLPMPEGRPPHDQEMHEGGRGMEEHGLYDYRAPNDRRGLNDSRGANEYRGHNDHRDRMDPRGGPPPQDYRSPIDSRLEGPEHFDIDHRVHNMDPRFDPRFDPRLEGPPISVPPTTGMPPALPLELPININQPPPGYTGPPPDIQLPDLTRPPPGFPPVPESTFQPEDLLPSLPYFDLPAGLMVPLIRLEDYTYKPLDPEAIRLPPPAPPSERLLAAVKAFYMPPRHENPRDSDGWEKLGLYEYFRAKIAAKKQKELEIDQGVRTKSRSPTPVRSWQDQAKSPPPKRRYSSRSRSKSRERDRNKRRSRRERSRSPPEQRTERRDSRGERDRSDREDRDRSDRDDRDRNDRDRDRDRERDRDRDDSRESTRETRSPTPPSFMGVGSYSNPNSEDRLGETNKGHQLLKKMGWGGAGLGAKEQGIEQPISGGDVRDRQDQYKGVGINLNDPYENFRKSKGQAFINRMKARAEERAS